MNGNVERIRYEETWNVRLNDAIGKARNEEGNAKMNENKTSINQTIHCEPRFQFFFVNLCGISHNFSGSVYSGRASMDTAPLPRGNSVVNLQLLMSQHILQLYWLQETKDGSHIKRL